MYVIFFSPRKGGYELIGHSKDCHYLLKILALWVPFMHGPYLKRPQPLSIVPLVSGLPLMVVEAQTRIRLPRVCQLQSSSLRVTDAALKVVFHCHWLAFTCMTIINLHEIFECAHLVSGRSKQTSIRAQCCHASVGLAQARPNYKFFLFPLGIICLFICLFVYLFVCFLFVCLFIYLFIRFLFVCYLLFWA